MKKLEFIKYFIVLVMINFMSCNEKDGDKDNIVSVTGVSISPSEIILAVRDVEKLEVTILPNNATNKGVIWASSNSHIATVTENGTVTAVAKGYDHRSGDITRKRNKSVSCLDKFQSFCRIGNRRWIKWNSLWHKMG